MNIEQTQNSLIGSRFFGTVDAVMMTSDNDKADRRVVHLLSAICLS